MSDDKWRHVHSAGSGGAGAFYGIGFVGALVYFILQAESFWDIVLGILKSIVWPAIFVYKIFEFLKI